MKVFWILIALAVLLISACQPAAESPQTLPTMAVLPSLTPEDASQQIPTQVEDTSTPLPTGTPPPVTVESTPTAEAEIPTELPLPTETILPPVTIEIREEVRFATLTPAPQGANQPIRTTPVIMADVVITQGDFQRAVDAALVGNDNIQRVEIDFEADGIGVELTALGGAAYITGRVKLLIQVSGSFVTITVGDVQVNAAEPPEAYLEVVSGEFFGLMLQVFDSLLTERLGEGHDLENIVINDQAMQVFLLVPQG